MRTLRDFAIRDDVDSRTEIWWAIGTVVVVMVLVAVASILYLRPLGRAEYRAVMSEAGGISAGTEVRVAGMPVGSVTAVSLADDAVDVSLSVDDSVFIGDQTTLEVRMLTVVGGAYVALLPSGRTPLGNKVIPEDRTSVPYSTAEVLDAAARTASDIDATTLRTTSVALGDTLKSAPGSARTILANVESLTALLESQRTQIESVADLGAEYTTVLAGMRSTLTEMIRRIRAVLPVMVGYRDRGMVTYAALAEMVLYVGNIFGEPYTTRFAPPLKQLTGAANGSLEMSRRMAAAIVSLRGISDKLAKVTGPQGVSVDNGDDVLGGGRICIPLAGRTC